MALKIERETKLQGQYVDLRGSPNDQGNSSIPSFTSGSLRPPQPAGRSPEPPQPTPPPLPSWFFSDERPGPITTCMTVPPPLTPALFGTDELTSFSVDFTRKISLGVQSIHFAKTIRYDQAITGTREMNTDAVKANLDLFAMTVASSFDEEASIRESSYPGTLGEVLNVLLNSRSLQDLGKVLPTSVHCVNTDLFREAFL